MTWEHTHRDGTWTQHEDGVACDLDKPAKLRGQRPNAISFDEWVARPTFPDTSATVKEAVAALELAGPDPAYSAGRVDFAEMLKTDAQWSLKHRFDELLGRPYLSTQLAAMLPADVALRLVERAEAVIVLRTQANLDRLANEINRTTEATIDRLAKTANEKREELTRERFGRTTRLD